MTAPKRPETIEHDGRLWVEIRRAAKFAHFKAVLIEEQARGGAFDLLELNGDVFVPLGAVNRLKRETAAMRTIERKARIERTPKPGKVHAQPRVGPISAHREKQAPLPMPGGRAGQGWLGQRKPD